VAVIDPDHTTLGDALRAIAGANPDKLALIGAERGLTWAALDAEVDRVAALWLSVGIGAGDVVCTCTSKRPEVVINFLALARIGAIVAPINHKLEHARIVDQVEVANMRGLLIEGVHDDIADGIADRVGGRVVIVGGSSRHRGTPWSANEALAPARMAGPSPHDPVYYNYTSGTTGRAKAAVHTHAQVLWNARSGVDELGFAPDDVFLGMFSVFAHPHELFHRALITGSTCVILDTMSPRVVCEAIAAHRVSWMMAVPSFYEMMLEHGGGGMDLASLRTLESGGAWVSPTTLDRLEAHFGCGFMPVWGSTETCGVALAMRPDRPRTPGATGRPVAPYEVIVVDDHDRPVTDGSPGEMWVRGPAVAREYVGMPGESASAFTNGWYRTGDLVRVGPDGLFHFVGRRYDMLKVGGIRVFPLEIEQVLRLHPEIAEAVVVRAEERVRGEIPRAVLRLVPGATLSAQQIRAFCRDHLAIYKVPRIVEIWAEIPRLPNGKVDRAAVAATPAVIA
jgi:long-chain acyl-CoA synthetase